MQKRIPQRSKIWIFSKPWVDHLQIEEVDKYIKNSKFSVKEKNSQLYVEVRYARTTSLSLKKNSKSFPIKEGWKETRDNGICYQLDGIFR